MAIPAATPALIGHVALIAASEQLRIEVVALGPGLGVRADADLLAHRAPRRERPSNTATTVQAATRPNRLHPVEPGPSRRRRAI